jgi:hypothetical protein|tara:strand:- start:41 stop:667 length:627 start_codon:yes stop_codon:yes gene_type:complete
MSYNPNYSNHEDNQGENNEPLYIPPADHNNSSYNPVANTYVSSSQQSLPQQPVILNIPVQVQPNNNDMTELLKVYSYRRSLIIFTAIDGFFLMLFALMSAPPLSLLLLLALLLVVFGYKGAKQYKSMYIILYLLYLFGSFIIEVGLLAANPTKSGGVIAFGIFRILIQMYIIYFTIKFYNMIRNLNVETLNLLRSGWNLARNPSFVLY